MLKDPCHLVTVTGIETEEATGTDMTTEVAAVSGVEEVVVVVVAAAVEVVPLYGWRSK